jgi:hypothetical protein
MTIAHRALYTAFASLGRPLSNGGRARHQNTEPAQSRRDGPMGSLTCSPWEGLYLEEDGKAERAFDNSGEISTELDRFLTSIMYGD